MNGAYMSPIKARMKRTSARTWLSGLVVTLTTIVAYFAFWYLAPGTTFIVGCVALICLIIAGWVLGGQNDY